MPVPRSLITLSPDYLGGAPVFTGTRVPIQNLFDYLQECDLEPFREGFPGVSREHALAVIKLAGETAIKPDAEKQAA
jgi:uncharacterized protein (DUF433 family)